MRILARAEQSGRTNRFWDRARTLLGVIVAGTAVVCPAVLSQGQVLTGNRVDLNNTGGGTAINFDDTANADNPDFSIFCNENFLDIDTFSGIQAFKITRAANSHTLRLEGNGVGVGAEVPNAELHVFGGGGSSPFTNSRVLVENIGSSQLREMVRLENNGGIDLRMVDNSTNTFFKMANVIEQFELASGPVQFRASKNASNNSLNLMPTGVGIGTFNPASTLHVRADIDNTAESSFLSSTITSEVVGGTAQTRSQLDLINNGPSIISMLNTNRPTFSQWFIATPEFGEVDSLSLRKNGPGAPNFTIFGDGNIRFSLNGVSNCTIKPNGNLFVRGVVQSSSDRNLKENINQVDVDDVLQKVVKLPISTWNYNFDAERTSHMGPMAQDFYQTFGLGDDDKTIANIDKDGVALAAIQGLHNKVQRKETEIQTLHEDLVQHRHTIADQQLLIQDLAMRLERLETQVLSQQ